MGLQFSGYSWKLGAGIICWSIHKWGLPQPRGTSIFGFWMVEGPPREKMYLQGMKVRVLVLQFCALVILRFLESQLWFFLSVKIQKILIYGLKEQKKCHKFKHQNLQNSQGYQNFRLDFTYDQFSNKEIQKTQLFDKIFETHRVLTNQLVPLEYKVSRKNIHL